MTRITNSFQLRYSIRRMLRNKLLVGSLFVAILYYLYPREISQRQEAATYDYPVTFNDKWGRKVVFIKTHKTGSTTLQSVLARLAKSQNLSVGLPLGKKNFFCYFNNRFKATQVDRKSPQILFHHLNPNYEELNHLIPKGDFGSYYITILRNVPETFQSRLIYYRNKDISGALPALKDPLRLAEETIDNYGAVLAKLGHKGVFNDQMRIVVGNWYYYQFQQKMPKSPQVILDEEISSLIDDMDSKIDLVLIAEYFEESLILLAELLNLPLDDIRFVRLYERFREGTNNGNMSIDYVLKLNEILKADFMIYEHFKATIERKISAYGIERMEKQKAVLKEANNKIAQTCIAGEVEVKQSSWKYFVPKQMTIKIFELKAGAPEFCKFYTWSEFEWLNYFRHQRVIT